MSKQIGNRLKSLRDYFELSVEDLSELISVCGETLLRWERGTCYPKAKNLKLISKHYGVSAEWILTGVADSANAIECLLSEDNVSDESQFFTLYTGLPADLRANITTFLKSTFSDGGVTAK